MYEFAPTPQAAQARLDQVNPKDYAHTRNALDTLTMAMELASLCAKASCQMPLTSARCQKTCCMLARACL